MRIFPRYVAFQFLKPFLFGLGIFAILIFLGDLFDKMPKLLRSSAGLPVVLEYLWLEVPYWMIRVIPMATLLATLYCVSGFVQSGEWIAVQAAGFDPRVFFRPMLAMAGFVALLSLLAQESVLPVCYFRAQKLWQEKIAAEWQFDRYQNVMLIGGAGRFVTVKMFEVRAGRMIRPVLDYYSPGGIVRQIDAQGADWDPGTSRWIFKGGVERHFEPGGRIAEQPFERFASDLEVPPRKLVPRARNPDEMSIREMLRYMREVQLLGGSLRETRAALHAKMAYPFANIILCAIGIPIALRLRRGHRAVGFALALGISFLYLWVTEVGRILGAGERVPPVVGAWIAPVVFGFWALRLFRRCEI